MSLPEVQEAGKWEAGLTYGQGLDTEPELEME